MISDYAMDTLLDLSRTNFVGPENPRIAATEMKGQIVVLIYQPPIKSPVVEMIGNAEYADEIALLAVQQYLIVVDSAVKEVRRDAFLPGYPG